MRFWSFRPTLLPDTFQNLVPDGNAVFFFPECVLLEISMYFYIINRR